MYMAAGTYSLVSRGSEHPPLSVLQNPVTPQPRYNFVKHPLQNNENICHQWLSDSFGVHHIGRAYSAPQTS